ncbi:hypothetical protein CEXT_434821 [Caerostris extrusa]|uniref:Uncharacterized protein n=1 Tax=Caerostris extrusa TaxID=172846 RepID=A0AAV4UJI3_CAEEX|nr:hypothetical protein CEXT_434821 [Caerostris extrusa]
MSKSKLSKPLYPTAWVETVGNRESSATQNSPFSPNIIEEARFRCDGSQSFDIAGRNSFGRLNPVTSETF